MLGGDKRLGFAGRLQRLAPRVSASGHARGHAWSSHGFNFKFVLGATAEKFLERNMETHKTWGDPCWHTPNRLAQESKTHIGKLGRGAGGNLMLARVERALRWLSWIWPPTLPGDAGCPIGECLRSRPQSTNRTNESSDPDRATLLPARHRRCG